MMSIDYSEPRFEELVKTATSVVEKVLDTNREVVRCTDVHHKYDDKFAMAEFMGSGGIGAACIWLHHLGVTDSELEDLAAEAREGDILLTYTEESSCVFINKETKTIADPRRRQTKIRGLGPLLSFTEKTTTEVTEYYWDYVTTSKLTIQSKNITKRINEICGKAKLTTRADVSPKPAGRARDPISVNLRWLFSQLGDSNTVSFTINRSAETCKTPRRNPEINSEYQFFEKLCAWSSDVRASLQSSAFTVQETDQDHATACSTQMLFVPVIPLLVTKEDTEDEHAVPQIEDQQKHVDPEADVNPNTDDAPEKDKKTKIVSLFKVDSASKFTFSGEDLALFVEAQSERLTTKKADIIKMIESHTLITPELCTFNMLLNHCTDICNGFCDGIGYLEEQLRKQLIDSLGKEVTPAEFTEYMDYHNRKLFKEGCDPSLFVYPVQRPGFYPEGLISITRPPAAPAVEEKSTDSSKKADKPISQPLYTLHNQLDTEMDFELPIDATVTAKFTCKPHLHGHIEHCFSSGSNSKATGLTIEATSRQFSGYVMLLGSLSEDNSFDTKLALVVRDKDCFDIELLTKSISGSSDGGLNMKSLSPDQQRFAHAYREMLLKTSLFAVLVVQIKPQLEMVLNLPNESLTKEISLSKTILKLITESDIGVDMFAYQDEGSETDGDGDDGDRVALVKKNVEKIEGALQRLKAQATNNSIQQAQYDKVVGNIIATCPLRIACQEGQQQSPPPPSVQSSGGAEVAVSESDTSLAHLPVILNKKFESVPELSLQSSSMSCGSKITQRTCKGQLLTKETTNSLTSSQLTPLHQQALSLLDGLTKGGAIPLQAVDLHVIASVTHHFDKSLLNIVIQDNVNPVEKVEQSTLLVASAIHNKPPSELINSDQLPRIKEFNPNALIAG
eukprot:TRINITY_DN13954_c0_g1_i1.p1 TRINITY_DN13954_c0_g1~~TRINITY_DN13954_c0_g1_i1.p1  ORF type:complete len:903 (+),score=185.96 TRINITY_DN13954_c0_g1_i1:83-2791(+)